MTCFLFVALVAAAAQDAIVISIREERWQQFMHNVSPDFAVAFHVRKLNGTLVELEHPRPKGVTRGAMGCYESHMRAWESIISTRETGLVFEDDAILMPDPGPIQAVIQEANRLSSLNPRCCYVYLSDNKPWVAPGTTTFDQSSHFLKFTWHSRQWHATVAQIITPNVAELLLLGARPIREPVDVYLANLDRKNTIVSLHSLTDLVSSGHNKSDT